MQRKQNRISSQQQDLSRCSHRWRMAMTPRRPARTTGGTPAATATARRQALQTIAGGPDVEMCVFPQTSCHLTAAYATHL